MKAATWFGVCLGRKNHSVKCCVVFGVPDDGQTPENQLYFVGLGL